MRLLHTTELRFEEFLDDKIPDYAILSHRWGDDKTEVSYQDFLEGKKKDSAGYAKILACCRFASSDTTTYRHRRLFRGRFEWVWIDTCCIDKSSSAELSEAINSMYRWYANCVVCYAHLSDVVYGNDPNKVITDFEDSQWFARGWTLQELLAPSHVMFFTEDWTCIGTRHSLVSQISKATGIASVYITGFCDMSPLSVSALEKFVWASTRTTSRLEDQAYCLLGLFDINMPLLYGEGNKAFRRLQFEILRSSNDESVFLWDRPIGWKWSRTRPQLSGLLAAEVTDFGPGLYYQNGENRHHLRKIVPGVSRPSYSVTNQGLEIRVPKQLAAKSKFFLPLNHVYFEQGTIQGVYAILLCRVTSAHLGESGNWERFIAKGSSKALPRLPAVVYEMGPSIGLFIAPKDWLWSREQLAEMETEFIYVTL